LAREFDDDILQDLLEDEDDLLLLNPEDGTFSNPKQAAKKSSSRPREVESTSSKKKNSGRSRDSGSSSSGSGKAAKIFLIVLAVLVIGVAAVLGVMQITGGNPFQFFGNQQQTVDPTPMVSDDAQSSADPAESEESSLPVEDDVDITEETPAASEEPAETEETAAWSGEGLAIAQLTATAGSSNLVDVDNVGNEQADGNHQVASSMAADLKAFIAAARAEGYGTMLSTCYREEVSASDALDVQEHSTGMVVDIVDVDAQMKEVFAQECTEEIQWLADNAAEYGFVLRFPEGKEELTGEDYIPYHFLYVGKAVAKDMADNDWCVEEYLAQ
jgi:D-alanyl-D-alanine carboxypeptidase